MKTPGRNDPCWCGSGKKFKRCHLGQPMPESAAQTAPTSVKNANLVKAGQVSPMRTVPDHIMRPSYAETGTPQGPRSRSCVKTAEEIERMRFAGGVAREVLDCVLGAVKPGVTTEELDILAHNVAIERGAYPSPLNYHGFPKSLCTSVNEIICHGIPDDRPLAEGDIINCDVTIFIGGMHGDCSETIFVGRPDPQSKKLVQTTYECLMAGIGSVSVGSRINEIGKAITAIAHKRGFSVVRDFAGHGIGAQFHMDPQVLHYRDIRQRGRIEPGMTFTIEPMINVGTYRCNVWPDNWTAVTTDGKRSAQFEHTILVMDEGVELLTGGEGEPWFRKQLAQWGMTS